MRLAAEYGRTVYFDDVDVEDLGWQLETGHDNPLLVNGYDYVTRIPGSAGQLFFGDDPAPIPFGIPLFTIQKDSFDLQERVRKIKKVFKDEYGRKKIVKLKFAYEPDRYYNVRLDGDVDLDRVFSKAGKGVIPLICDEGFAESIVSSDEVLWGSEEVTFASTAYTFGHVAGGLSSTFTSAGSTVVEVVGDAVRPLIRVKGTGANVSLKIGNYSLNLGTFTNAEWVIDLKEYTILKNGLNAVVAGDWVLMDFRPGTNTISVNGAGLNLNVKFEFKDIWYG